MAIPYRQMSVTGRTCCICDRPCAILDCQCLENFQQNTTEHGNLMKRLSAAFSMPVSAKDLHSFSVCCSCEHHLVVIEQANRIKECMKQVFIETREHRKFVSNHLSKHGKPPPLVLCARAKRLSSVFADSRSFDEASPRVKRSRATISSSFPVSYVKSINEMSNSNFQTKNQSAKKFTVHDDNNFNKINQLDFTTSFDSVFLPPVNDMKSSASSSTTIAPESQTSGMSSDQGVLLETSSCNMDLGVDHEQPPHSI